MLGHWKGRLGMNNLPIWFMILKGFIVVFKGSKIWIYNRLFGKLVFCVQ
jgi:hypothetical protein